MSDSGRTLNSQPMGADYWKDWYYKEFQKRCEYMEEVERLRAQGPSSFYEDLLKENRKLEEELAQKNTELSRFRMDPDIIYSLYDNLRDANLKLKEDNRSLLNTIDSFRERVSNLAAMLRVPETEE